MQVHFDDIAGSECLLWQGGEEQLVDDACTSDAHWTLVLACGMGSDNHAAGCPERSNRDLRAIVETTHHLAFGALLDLIRWHVQTRRNARMIEQAVVLATGHKPEASQIGEHSPVPLLAVEAQQRVLRWKLVPCEIPADGGEALAQFRSRQPMASVSETAEPLGALGLRHRSACPDHLCTLAAPRARSADVNPTS
jgi:hypothetical protein